MTVGVVAAEACLVDPFLGENRRNRGVRHWAFVLALLGAVPAFLDNLAVACLVEGAFLEGTFLEVEVLGTGTCAEVLFEILEVVVLPFVGCSSMVESLALDPEDHSEDHPEVEQREHPVQTLELMAEMPFHFHRFCLSWAVLGHACSSRTRKTSPYHHLLDRAQEAYLDLLMEGDSAVVIELEEGEEEGQRDLLVLVLGSSFAKKSPAPC